LCIAIARRHPFINASSGLTAVLLESVGLEKVADQATLGEWLRAQTPESVRRLCKLNSDFVKEVLPESKPSRVRHGGELEVFFDDTENQPLVGGSKPATQLVS
jgi:hypothetical protein